MFKMGDTASALPDIIKAAASSPLGIIALMVIALSFLAYRFFRRSSDVWKFGALLLLFGGCLAFGAAVLREVNAPDPGGDTEGVASSSFLESALTRLVAESEKAKKARTIGPGRPLPGDLATARGNFESAWWASSLDQRKRLDPDIAYKGLSSVVGVYRVQETDSSMQTNANAWADEAIRYFEQVQNPQRLTDALLDKAAIYLDLAQLGHDDKRQFETMAREGDAVMARAFQTSSPEQKPEVLRLTSRFYYDLARPRSFRLSDAWDNNYLLLAYDKAREAYQLSPQDSKNSNQVARIAIKVSKNPPQDRDPAWTKNLRDAQQAAKAAWETSQTQRTTLAQRLSPLNVMGVATLETVAREWRELAPAARRSRARRYLEELDNDALGPLREATALLSNSELRKSHDFDLHYDLARAHCVRTAIVRVATPERTKSAFAEVEANLALAREGATASQLDAAMKSLDGESTFLLLTASERKRLGHVLTNGRAS